MEIIRHLSNEELAELAIESDQQSLRQTFEALPGWARAATERQDEFWQKQRISVWSRISTAENRTARRSPILAWAFAATLIAVSGWLLERPVAVPPHESHVDPDHELLLQVERVVRTDGPLALEPAALLAQEMVQGLPVRNSPIRKKEPSDEN